MAVLVTRPQPDDEATALALRAKGFEVLLAPMLRFHELSTPLTDQPLQFAPVGTQMNPTFGLIPFAGGTAGNPSSG